MIKIDGLLQTSKYRKPMDENTILGMDRHPTPLKCSLQISQLYRLKRICSTTHESDEQTKFSLAHSQ